MAKDKRTLLYPNAYLEYDKEGYVFFTDYIPEFLLPIGHKAGDPYVIEGVHVTMDLLQKRAAEFTEVVD